jgi:hypothetical protein
MVYIAVSVKFESITRQRAVSPKGHNPGPGERA